MTNFKTLILLIAGLVLVGCGDPRAAEKEAMKEALADSIGATAAACIIDTMSANVDDDGWKALNFLYKKQRDEAREWAEEESIDTVALGEQIEKAAVKAEEVCDAANVLF
ncbi:MAG: hypothetical protein CMQ75_01120 [Gammaproteobacteria bacterium]|nr:hypothetical protein [Gammaproteobacteria bacterium]|tara:strand:- start:4969 stop:5298 length:330 start_codon:yes stop_codon:yes gene_type:complete